MTFGMVILGRQGSGKGTQAVHIAEQYEVIHIYTYFISAGGDPINGEKGNLKSGKQRSASTRSPKHQGQEKGGETRRRSLQPEIS